RSQPGKAGARSLGNGAAGSGENAWQCGNWVAAAIVHFKQNATAIGNPDTQANGFDPLCRFEHDSEKLVRSCARTTVEADGKACRPTQPAGTKVAKLRPKGVASRTTAIRNTSAGRRTPGAPAASAS